MERVGKLEPFGPPATEATRRFGADIMARTPDLIKAGVRSNPVEVRGGLEAVPQGFADMQVSAHSRSCTVYTADSSGR
jgi:hypothetical protein